MSLFFCCCGSGDGGGDGGSGGSGGDGGSDFDGGGDGGVMGGVGCASCYFEILGIKTHSHSLPLISCLRCHQPLNPLNL